METSSRMNNPSGNTVSEGGASTAAARRYTVREIDEMRKMLDLKFEFGFYTYPNLPSGTVLHGRSYQGNEKTKWVEERLRTHMMAGHTAADLIASQAVGDRTDGTKTETGA